MFNSEVTISNQTIVSEYQVHTAHTNCLSLLLENNKTWDENLEGLNLDHQL